MKVINMRDNPSALNFAIRVDRQGKYGNPFVMKTEDERDDVCDKFEKYAEWRLLIEPDWLDALRGQDLACWCAPKRCHADTLMRLANRRTGTDHGVRL